MMTEIGNEQNETTQQQQSANNVILNRLKEIENSNASLVIMLENLKNENKSKDEKIKELSEDKRKDMEQMIDTAVEKWLNSLTDVSEDVKKQFKQGITKLAEQADVKNAAWEIVCNASRAHETNVKKIEDLVKTCNEQGETIKTLLGNKNDSTFESVASRLEDSSLEQTTHRAAKRSRINDETPITQSQQASAWDDFAQMMQTQNKSSYF